MTRLSARLAVNAVVIVALGLTNGALAAEPNNAPKDVHAAADTPKPMLQITEHSSKINGERVSYQAIAGETYLKDDKGQPLASIYSISYLRTGIKLSDDRPVTFIFNGGPGSASLWLHLGLFGPKRIELPAGVTDDGAAPYRLINNDDSLLDMSDLVFIDPVGTGFSRALGEKKGSDFWGVKEDAQSVAEFIRLWLIEHKRWNSPKYIAGESYGTTRAAALVKELQGGWTDIAVNGIVLISSILDFSNNRYQPGNNMPYIGYLPTMAATAFYHDKVSDSDKAMGLEAFVQAAREFSLNEYATALLKGARLSKAEYAKVRDSLARFSGLTEAYLDSVNLRVSAHRYFKQLLRDRGETVGRLDSRYIGHDYDSGGEYFDNDPSGYGMDAAYTAAMHQYLYGELGVKTTRKFNVLSGDVNRNWNWAVSGKKMHYVNVAPNIGEAQRENKDLKVMVANGYFDFATPFLATENTFSGNGIDASRVQMFYYPAGHMMYIDPASLKKLVTDIRGFYQN